MYKKYTIPISIFIVFENLSPITWTSKSLSPNTNISYISSQWLNTINLFFKNELFLCNSMLVENTGYDNTKSLFLKTNAFLQNQTVIIYYYYFYWLKARLVLITSVQNNTIPINQHKKIHYTNLYKMCKVKNKLPSLDKIFKSAGWLERETAEMLGVKFSNKLDTRRLLLDYSKQEHPLLKDFPVEGISDVFYNVFEDHVVILKSTVVEL